MYFSSAPTLNIRDECGTVNSTKSSVRRARREDRKEAGDFIMGGVNASEGHYPWHASITYSGPQYPACHHFGDHCGATLISSRVLITAAHCLFDQNEQEYKATDLKIALGVLDVVTNEPLPHHQRIMLKRTVIHPKYNRHTKVYDVALLFLATEATITPHVRPICLWDDDYDLDKIKNKPGTVVGWGLQEDKNKNRYLARYLQFGQLSVLNHRDCYEKEKNFYSRYLHPGFNFCASGTNDENKRVSACQGDSGGSFIMKKNSAWYLRGVVSFGIQKNSEVNFVKEVKSCDEGYPSLYADLGSCMDWIVQEVKKPSPWIGF